uniref:Chitin-binding type-2 domain-containing protein n=1 Tax=Anopheles coluzzii TaxID=1518534 RepID=A0A8W7Q3D8_ANOCL
MARRMRYGAVVLLVLLVAGSLAMYATNNERCTCAPGPPDYLCPSAPLLQVYLPHELYCTRYYKCTDGRAIEFQCPYGLYFDTQNNTCTCDFTQCYRTDPCIVFVDSCRCCNRQFENTGLAPENFYVCYNDGYAVATTCPVALDPCTGSQVQLQFVNQKCEVPPPSTTTVATTTTTAASTTTTTTEATTTTTTEATTTTTTEATTTTTTEATTTTTAAPVV